jgi:hypothetical protein
MKRLLLSSLPPLAVVFTLLRISLSNTAFGPLEDKNVYAKSRPDAALLYICYDAYAGPVANLYLFCDDQLIAALPKKTYTYAYVTPGTHLVWSEHWGKVFLDCAAGQTYYISTSMKPSWEMYIASESDGQAQIKKANRYVEANQKDRRKAEAIVSKKWPKHKEEAGSNLKAPPEGDVSTLPAGAENTVRIRAGTAVTAEVMENLHSALNKTGDIIWLRAAEDVNVNGIKFVTKGTPIKAVVRDAKKRGRFMQGGMLDLTVISIIAADGTVSPLIGQVLLVGSQGSIGAAAIPLLAVPGIASSLVVGSLKKGLDSFCPAGGELKVFTRRDTWIKTSQPISTAAPPDGQFSETVKAYARERIICDLRKGNVPQFVHIVFEGMEDIKGVELLGVAGGIIPIPIRPGNLSRVTGGWAAQFRGWELCRFLRYGDEGTKLEFRLTVPNGKATRAQATVMMSGK